jgi:hypothetical protein
MAEPRTFVGEHDIRSVYNGTGGTLSKGTIVKYNSSGRTDEIVAAAADTDAYLGVLTEDIATLSMGNCQVRGGTLVLAGAAVAKQARVMFGTGAKGITATAGKAVLGIARTAASGADVLFEVELTGPGGTEMPG